VLRLWGRSVAAVVLASITGLVLWPIVGGTRALWLYIGLLLLLLLHHIYHLTQLHRWLKDPRLDTLPEGRLEWEEIFAALARLLRRRTHIESRLSAALERFQQAGAALPEGVIILDESDAITWCNPKAEHYFGLSNQRDRGQQITYLVRNPQFVEYLETRNFREPLLLRSKREDQELSLSVQLVPYGASEKLLLSRDITRWERMETTRRDFVANVSHELRTPLTVLSGFLETLADTPDAEPEMLRRSLELMGEQARRMHQLVEDLLTLSRLESAQNPMREELVDIAALVRKLFAEAQAISAGRHRLSLRTDNPNGLRGSAEELRSAFTNLISNAVRYTPEHKGIEIAWTTRGTDPAFVVRDEGIGIEAHHIPRLTERFYRVDRGRSRANGGTGLGLAIVKHILSRHQAHLEVTSVLGKGTTFTAVFPAARAALTTEEPAEVAALQDGSSAGS
jgi:two-component system, OmpR family, phosphate regulon sensor histidine kinase PhoR